MAYFFFDAAAEKIKKEWQRSTDLGPMLYSSGLVLLLAILGSADLSARSLAEPNKVQYELAERCAKTAKALFQNSGWGNGIVDTPDGQTIASFKNHYNPDLNKC